MKRVCRTRSEAPCQDKEGSGLFRTPFTRPAPSLPRWVVTVSLVSRTCFSSFQRAARSDRPLVTRDSNHGHLSYSHSTPKSPRVCEITIPTPPVCCVILPAYCHSHLTSASCPSPVACGSLGALTHVPSSSLLYSQSHTQRLTTRQAKSYPACPTPSPPTRRRSTRTPPGLAAGRASPTRVSIASSGPPLVLPSWPSSPSLLPPLPPTPASPFHSPPPTPHAPRPMPHTPPPPRSPS